MRDDEDRIDGPQPGQAPDTEPARRPRHRRHIVLGLLALAVAAVVIVVVTTTGGGSSAGAKRTGSVTTVKIQRRDLVETDTETGTLGYADAQPVVNRLSGTITWLPASGRVVQVDHTLFRVDNQPVVLLDGRTPAYRTLQSSVTDGPDVLELERSLHGLGYDAGNPLTVDGSWDAATTAAVESFQTAHGLTSDGVLPLGQVVFQPGTARRVASVQASLGGTGSGGGGGATTTGAAFAGSARLIPAVWRIEAPAPAEPTAIIARASAATTCSNSGTRSGPAGATGPAGVTGPTGPTGAAGTPPAGATPCPSGSGSSPSSGATTRTTAAVAPGAGGGRTAGATAAAATGGSTSGSGSGGTATTVMTTTSTRQQVTVNLDTGKQSVAVIGAPVTVQMPSGAFVRGRIVSVGKVATSSSSSSGSTSGGGTGGGGSGSSSAATIPVSIRLNRPRAAGLDQAPVSVRFEQGRARNVLAVPVTALLAQPGGTFAVEVVDAGTHRIVAVTPGVFTSGYVQITGSGLQPGMRVTNAGD